MSDCIYLIEELRTDSFENQANLAIRYVVAGFVTAKTDAEAIVIAAGLRDPDNWAMQTALPNMRFREITRINT